MPVGWGVMLSLRGALIESKYPHGITPQLQQQSANSHTFRNSDENNDIIILVIGVWGYGRCVMVTPRAFRMWRCLRIRDED